MPEIDTPCDGAVKISFLEQMRKFFLPLFFLAVLLYNPSLFFAPGRPWPLLVFSCGALSFLALGFLLFSPEKIYTLFRKGKKSFLLPFSLFFPVAFLQGLFLKGYSPECVGLNLLFLSVPLLICVYRKNAEKYFTAFLIILWFWNLFQMLVARYSYKLPFFWRTGIAGNSNWNAALLAAATPFVVITFYKFLQKQNVSKKLSIILSLVPALVGTGYFLYCRSAAGFLAVVAVTVFLFFCFLSAKYRKIFFFAGLFCALAGALLFLHCGGIDRLAGRMAYDERLVLWQGTLDMILDHPVFGVGGQSFENAFVEYKPLELFLKKHVAPRTGHPHNHILYMIASFGLLGGLCWMFLHFYPLIVIAVKLWKSEEELSVLPYFYGSAVLTLHAMLDVLSVNWPTNIIELSLLGFLWHRVFFTKKADDDKSIVLKKSFSYASIFCGCILLFIAFSMIARSTYASCRVQDLMTKRFTPQKSREIVRNILRIYPEGYVQNYALLNFARMILKDPRLTLQIIEVMKKGHIPNYGNIHLFKGDAYSLLYKYEEAFAAYKQEAKNWPLAVIPVCKMIVLAQKNGDGAALASLQKLLAEIMKAKNINKRMLDYILYKDPSMDLQVWMIPREHGGQGGYGQAVQKE